MNSKELLNELASLAPQIDNRIGELTSSVIQEEFDPVETTARLVNEAATMLLDLLSDNGILFYVDIQTLLDNKRGIEFLCSLYKMYLSTNINVLLDDKAILNNIASSIGDIADEEFISTLLESVRDTHPSEFNDEMYDYFHDKIVSNSKYVSEISGLIQRREMRNDYDSDIVVTEDVIPFLAKIGKERNWYYSTVLSLITNKIIIVDYTTIEPTCERFCFDYCILKNSVILSKYNEIMSENHEIVDSIMKDIRSSSEFYVDHYSDTELSILPNNVIVGIILTQLSDKRLFDIDPNFDRLAKSNPTVLTIIKAIPIQNEIK